MVKPQFQTTRQDFAYRYYYIHILYTQLFDVMCTSLQRVSRIRHCTNYRPLNGYCPRTFITHQQSIKNCK